MKILICLAALISTAATGQTFALPSVQAPLTYSDIVREARRSDSLESTEPVVASAVVNRRVRVGLLRILGSTNFRVRRQDSIVFTCTYAEAGFKGGDVVAVITKHEKGADGGHVYTLANCAAKK